MGPYGISGIKGVLLSQPGFCIGRLSGTRVSSGRLARPRRPGARPKRIAVLLALLALGPAAGHALAGDVSGQSICDAGPGGFDNDLRSGGSTVFTSCSETWEVESDDPVNAQATSSTSALAVAKKIAGTATTQVSAAGAVGNTTFSARGRSTGSLADFFFVDALNDASVTVQEGTMVVNLLLSGSLQAWRADGGTASTRASLDYQIVVGSAVEADQITRNAVSTPEGSLLPINRPISLFLPWTAGEPVSVTMVLIGDVFSEVSGTGIGQANFIFGNSLDWLGISDVRDANGDPVASFTAIGPTADWATPVPLPATLPAFVGMLTVLALFRRRGPRSIGSGPG